MFLFLPFWHLEFVPTSPFPRCVLEKIAIVSGVVICQYSIILLLAFVKITLSIHSLPHTDLEEKVTGKFWIINQLIYKRVSFIRGEIRKLSRHNLIVSVVYIVAVTILIYNLVTNHLTTKRWFILGWLFYHLIQTQHTLHIVY